MSKDALVGVIIRRWCTRATRLVSGREASAVYRWREPAEVGTTSGASDVNFESHLECVDGFEKRCTLRKVSLNVRFGHVGIFSNLLLKDFRGMGPWSIAFYHSWLQDDLRRDGRVRTPEDRWVDMRNVNERRSVQHTASNIIPTPVSPT